MMRIVFLVVCAAALGVGRFFVPSHELSLAGSYEAVAHLFVGGLIGAWLCGMSWQRSVPSVEGVNEEWVHPHHLYMALLVVLTLVELYCFLHR